MHSATRFRIAATSVLACLIAVCDAGCAPVGPGQGPSRCQGTSYRPTTPALTGKPGDWEVTSTIRPPADWSAFDQTLTLVIDSDPSGADVYSAEQTDTGGLTTKEKVGTTPLEVRIEFCELNQIPWFRDPAILDGRLSEYRAKGAPLHGFFWPTDMTFSAPPKSPYWSPIVEQGVCIKSRRGDSSGSYSTPYMHEVKVANELYVAGNELKRTSTNESSEYDFKLYIDHRDCYGVFVSTGFRFDKTGTRLIGSRGASSILLNGSQVRPYGFPVKLLKHGRVLANDMAKAIDQGDYYGAEELRLGRINDLERQLGENKEFFSDKSVPESGLTATNAVQGQLINSELDRLKHTVGLLDPQLMGLRKQLLVKLKEGNVDAAFALAQAVEAMEKRYFPLEPPPTIVVRESIREGTGSSGEVQAVQTGGRQEIVVQQKPYYGVTNIVQALGAMRGSKLDPEGYQRAFGTAQLMDIMGVGASLLNK